MKDLVDKIKNNKPNISESTIKTYTSLLKSFYYKHHEKGSQMNMDWFEDQDHIIKLLADKPASSRKTTFASLIAVSKDNDKYKKALINDGKKYQEFINTQTKTQSQEDNWKSYEDVKSMYENMYERVKPLLNSKEKLSSKEFKALMDFVILSLTSGYWIPPRRSLDWTSMQFKKSDGDDNYIDKSKFVFRKYKTSKFYDEQTVEIPKGLKTILTKWAKHNPHDYLLVDASGKPISNVRLTQKLNAIFDGNVSTSLLRHIYLSDKLKDVPALESLQKQATDMGHSVMEALQYVKK
jgi:hypothetical protein